MDVTYYTYLHISRHLIQQVVAHVYVLVECRLRLQYSVCAYICISYIMYMELSTPDHDDIKLQPLPDYLPSPQFLKKLLSYGLVALPFCFRSTGCLDIFTDFRWLFWQLSNSPMARPLGIPNPYFHITAFSISAWPVCKALEPHASGPGFDPRCWR